MERYGNLNFESLDTTGAYYSGVKLWSVLRLLAELHRGSDPSRVPCSRLREHGVPRPSRIPGTCSRSREHGTQISCTASLAIHFVEPWWRSARSLSVFVPQSVRECQEYYPQVLELPKEHLKHLRERGELAPDESPGGEAEERRRSYLEQPVRPVLKVVGDDRLPRLVILGDPGASPPRPASQPKLVEGSGYQ